MAVMTGRRGFEQAAWDAAYRRRVDKAFAEVPFYREQWAVAGRVLADPVPTPSVELAEELYRLCPLRRLWRPTQEPSLWPGDGGDLRDALASAGYADPRTPVLEVRPALLDRPRLGGRGGAPYGVLLAPDADTGGQPSRRPGLHLHAAGLAAAAGEAVLVGADHELGQAAEELSALLAGRPCELHRVRRAPAGDEHADLAYDPALGYLGGRASCGRVHVSWRRFHVRPGDPATVTALLSDRPTLAGIVPTGSAAPGVCPEHGVPTLD